MNTILIYKILSGNANDTEKKELDNWLSQGQDNANEFNNLKLLWENSTGQEQNSSIEGLRKIKMLMQLKLKRREQNKRNRILIVLLILVIVFVAFLIANKNSKPHNKHLQFNNANMGQVINTLESEYNVHIELGNESIANCKFTGLFYKTENVNTILNALDESLMLQHKYIDGKKYLLTGAGCPNAQ